MYKLPLFVTMCFLWYITKLRLLFCTQKFYRHVRTVCKSLTKIPANGHFNIIYCGHNSFRKYYKAVIVPFTTHADANENACKIHHVCTLNSLTKHIRFIVKL